MKKKIMLASIFFFFLFSFSNAQSISRDPLSDLPDLISQAAVVIDADTGTLLYYKNPDEEIPPASLTKLMTIHLALNEVQAGRLSLDSEIIPPEESWYTNQPPGSSLMFLDEGQHTNLRELILGLAVPSGNDAAVAVALQVAPTVEEFVDMMNREAQALGMTKTRFVEPSGISEYNFTTAREFAYFCRFYIRNHPETMKEYHSVLSFEYPKRENMVGGRRARIAADQRNSNRLLTTVEGVDGLKTGYIDEAGYNIALTAQRGETRFIAVILGAPVRGGDVIRNEEGRQLLNWAFDNYKTVRLQPPELEKVRIWKGTANYVSISPDEVLNFTAHTSRAISIEHKIELFDTLIAPLPLGSLIGNFILYDDEGELYRVPLVTTEEIPAGNFFKRLFDSIRLFFYEKKVISTYRN